MAFVTHNQIRSYARGLAKSLLEEAAIPKNKRVFVSHSHLDQLDLEGLVGLLDKFGAAPYVDVEDSTLHDRRGAEIARHLRKQIKRCPRFILATSGNIRHSRWTPWELGLADGSLAGCGKTSISHS